MTALGICMVHLVSAWFSHRVPLQLADGSGTSYNLQKVPRTDNYEIPVILPDDITCPACTLQVSRAKVFLDSRPAHYTHCH